MQNFRIIDSNVSAISLILYSTPDDVDIERDIKTVKPTKEPVKADLLAEDECGGGEERGDQPDTQQRAQGEAAAALPSQGGHDDLLIIS